MNGWRVCIPLSIFLLLARFSASAQCNRANDSLQLINLYNATGGANWTNQWNFNQPITTWYGIRTNTEGCVTFIDLDGNADFSTAGSSNAGSNNLTGQLPTLTFPELLYMFLDNNQLSGTLPALNLPKINNLGIAHNPLIKGTIPTSWNFPDLEYLGLCCDGLDGVLPTLNFPKLIGIYLQDNQLHGELPVLNLPLLNELDFGRNNFSNCFPAAYRTLCSIRSHNFFNNPLLPNNGNFDEFCTNNSGICNNTTSCRYQDSLILANYFFPAMNGPNWRVQNFGGVKSPWVLSEPMENWLGVHFDNFDCVAQISLANNNLSGTLPTELMQLTNLNYLGLSNNQIVGSIPTSIGNLTKLTALDLSYNQLTGTLPPSLGNLRELILCYFGVNSNLTGDIPPSLGNLTKVEDLFLNECDFTGKIPPELGNMTNLKKMLLSSNRLSDTLPTSLGNLQNLKTMGLDENQLTGKIPVSFRNLSKLVCLIFNNNQIDSVPNLTNLAQLDTGCLASYINRLTFDDIVPNQRPNAPRFSHSYGQQADFFKDTTVQGVLNAPLSIDLKIDATMAENVWRWNKNGTFWRTETGINKLIFNNLQSTDAGIYDVQVTNPKAPNLTLQSRKITINSCTNTVNTTTQTPVLCNGQTYRLPNGQIVNTATNYRDTLRYQSGCDSLIRIVNVTTNNNTATTNLNPNICRGQSYTLPNGQIVTPSVTTTYRDTLKSQAGCDSLIRIVTVTPNNSAATTNLNPNICKGQSYTLPNGQIVTPSVTTTYRDTLKSRAGCDSLIRIVTVTPTNSAATTNLNPNICKGQSYTLPNGQIVTPSVTTTYRDTLKSRAGCDSLIRITNLTVSSTLIEAIDEELELNTGDSAIINLILNDKLGGQNGRITLLKTPSEGVTQRVNDSQIRYTAPQILRGPKEQTLSYKVCLTDCPDNCDSATLRITIDENNIATGRIKNGVAPQLSGEEYFEIDSIQAFTQAQLFIYNSWNELVFKSAVPYDNRWKGTGQNDAPLPSGVYYYVLRHIAPNRKHLEGKILLLHD